MSSGRSSAAQYVPPTRQEDNSLVLEGLSPGEYWFRFRSDRGYVASATMGSVDVLHSPMVVGSGSSAPLEVTMRDDFAQIELVLATSATGESYTASPAPATRSARGAIVYCIPLPGSPGQFQQISVPPDGKLLPKIPPGMYHVLAFDTAQPDLFYRDPDAMRSYESKGEVVHLQGGQKELVRLAVIPTSN